MEREINKHPPKPELKIQPLNELDLYEVRVITDIEAGELRWYVPMTARGHTDLKRPFKFRGMSPVMTPVGVQTMEFTLDATDIYDALIEWPRKLEAKIREFQESLEKAQRRAQLLTPSSIPPRGKRI